MKDWLAQSPHFYLEFASPEKKKERRVVHGNLPLKFHKLDCVSNRLFVSLVEDIPGNKMAQNERHSKLVCIIICTNP